MIFLIQSNITAIPTAIIVLERERGRERDMKKQDRKKEKDIENRREKQCAQNPSEPNPMNLMKVVCVTSFSVQLMFSRN